MYQHNFQNVQILMPFSYNRNTSDYYYCYDFIFCLRGAIVIKYNYFTYMRNYHGTLCLVQLVAARKDCFKCLYFNFGVGCLGIRFFIYWTLYFYLHQSLPGWLISLVSKFLLHNVLNHNRRTLDSNMGSSRLILSLLQEFKLLNQGTLFHFLWWYDKRSNCLRTCA
jgi:hypothetical protein